jgi:hypothetical protein
MGGAARTSWRRSNRTSFPAKIRDVDAEVAEFKRPILE